MAFGGSDLSETQQCIVNTYDRNPDITPKGIADACGCSESYVRQTLREHRSGVLGGYGNDDGIL